MWEQIAGSFSGLTPLGWASQICGLIGLVFLGISYLCKKKTFLLIASFAFVFFILEQVFVYLWGGLIVTCVCFARNLLMLFFLWKKNKELSKQLVYGLLVLMWVLLIVYMAITHEFGVWTNYVPAAVVTLSTFTQNSKNELIVKGGATIHETGFLIFYLNIPNMPISVMRQILLVVAGLIGLTLVIIRLIKNNKNAPVAESEPIVENESTAEEGQ